MSHIDCVMVQEREFAGLVRTALQDLPAPDFIVGPGRSGAIAAVYASYHLHRPFVPYGHRGAEPGARVLVIDTVSMSGRTMRKAKGRYERLGYVVDAVTVVPPNQKRHHFWFENV